jgi:short-subunit dehydrogenase
VLVARRSDRLEALKSQLQDQHKVLHSIIAYTALQETRTNQTTPMLRMHAWCRLTFTP